MCSNHKCKALRQITGFTAHYLQVDCARRVPKPILCLAALAALCCASLLLRAPPIIGSSDPVNAVNFELLDRVLTTEQPKDPRAHSQLGQDKWVARLHPSPGFYLDLGANSATDLSNTHALDALGWQGVCVDPFPVGFSNPEANRSCRVVAAAVAADGGRSVDFVRPRNGQLGGILDSLGSHRDEALSANGTTIVTLQTLGIGELLAGSPSHGAPSVLSIPRHIDYLSLDVEGQEAEILAAWPWDRHSVGLVTVEHNYESQKRRRIHKALLSHGMRFAYHVDVDDWFQNATLYPVAGSAGG